MVPEYALGAETVILLLASFAMEYPVSHVAAVQSMIPDGPFDPVFVVTEGSTGSAGMYVVTNSSHSPVAPAGKFVLSIFVAELLADCNAVGKFP